MSAWLLDQASVTELIAPLWRTSWQAGFVAAGLAVACASFAIVPPAARRTLWWLVCLKFVVGLAWVQPVALPLLPAETVPTSIESAAALAPNHAVAAASAPSPSTSSLVGTLLEHWRGVLIGLWLTGLFIELWVLARQHARARQILSRALPAEANVNALFEQLCRRLGVKKTPRLRASAEIASPQVSGLFHSTVLLPADSRTWSASDLSMALGHELMHVRRRDLWHGLVPAVAARLFFFHPLARLAAREYVLAREAACDADTLSMLGVTPAAYGQLLVRFGVTGSRRAPAIGGASHTFRMLKRRLLMLQNPHTYAQTPHWRWLALAGVVSLALVPFRLTARGADATELAAQASPEESRAAGATREARPQLPAHEAQTHREAGHFVRKLHETAVEARHFEHRIEHEVRRAVEHPSHSMFGQRSHAAPENRVQVGDGHPDREALAHTVEQLRSAADEARRTEQQALKAAEQAVREQSDVVRRAVEEAKRQAEQSLRSGRDARERINEAQRQVEEVLRQHSDAGRLAVEQTLQDAFRQERDAQTLADEARKHRAEQAREDARESRAAAEQALRQERSRRESSPGQIAGKDELVEKIARLRINLERKQLEQRLRELQAEISKLQERLSSLTERSKD